MPYSALPDRRMPWDDDGTVFITSTQGQPYTSGATTYPTGSESIALNGQATLTSSIYAPAQVSDSQYFGFWWFFPEQREVTGFIGVAVDSVATFTPILEGSNDTTDGLNGSWETATISGGAGNLVNHVALTAIDAWRSSIASVSFTGPKQVIRLRGSQCLGGESHFSLLHIYGRKAAGQTPNDIVFLDGDNAFAEFATPEDFGDVPLGTTTVRQWKVKNTSATATATTISLQCNDADFSISTDGSTWVVTIDIASLAAGATSGIMYIRDTTPNPGAPLGPRFARIVCTVGSWV